MKNSSKNGKSWNRLDSEHGIVFVQLNIWTPEWMTSPWQWQGGPILMSLEGNFECYVWGTFHLTSQPKPSIYDVAHLQWSDRHWLNLHRVCLPKGDEFPEKLECVTCLSVHLSKEVPGSLSWESYLIYSYPPPNVLSNFEYIEVLKAYLWNELVNNE